MGGRGRDVSVHCGGHLPPHCTAFSIPLDLSQLEPGIEASPTDNLAFISPSIT